jgi:hypothetical protein
MRDPQSPPGIEAKLHWLPDVGIARHELDLETLRQVKLRQLLFGGKRIGFDDERGLGQGRSGAAKERDRCQQRFHV